MAHPTPSPGRPHAAAPSALDDAQLRSMQSLLETVPAPLEPLDVSMLDGYLCGVLVQPRVVPAARWLPLVIDVEGRRPATGIDLTLLRDAILLRHRLLDDLITRRQWFDPWVFELGDDADSAVHEADVQAHPDEGAEAAAQAARAADAVLPWAAGFVMALETFPALLQSDDDGLIDALALLYRNLDLDGLDDVEALQEQIESLEAPADLGAAVEELVRATLLLADIGRPQLAPAPSSGAARRGATRPRRATRR